MSTGRADNRPSTIIQSNALKDHIILDLYCDCKFMNERTNGLFQF